MDSMYTQRWGNYQGLTPTSEMCISYLQYNQTPVYILPPLLYLFLSFLTRLLWLRELYAGLCTNGNKRTLNLVLMCFDTYMHMHAYFSCYQLADRAPSSHAAAVNLLYYLLGGVSKAVVVIIKNRAAENVDSIVFLCISPQQRPL